MNKYFNLEELISTDEIERLCEISEEKCEVLHDQFRNLGKRLAELPMVINQTKQLIEVDQDIISSQRLKLIEFNEAILKDCTLEFVILAIELDIKNRKILVDRGRESLKAYQKEYDETAAIYSDTIKDMEALKKLTSLMERVLSQKTEIPMSTKHEVSVPIFKAI